MKNDKPDFSGWASKNGLKCADGRVITHGAFKDQDKAQVPLVWAHKHDDPMNVLGHALLETREEGTYVYGFFNDGARAQASKMLLEHGDVDSLSIWANNLVEQNENVLHGTIREVSLVLAGANPGAKIENVHLQHGDSIITLDEEAIITTGIHLEHADTDEAPASSTEDDVTVSDIINSMTEEQKAAVAYVVAKATDELEHDAVGDDDPVDPADPSDPENPTDPAPAVPVVPEIPEDPKADPAPKTDADEDPAPADSGDHIKHSQEGTPMTRNVFEGDAIGKTDAPSFSHDDMKAIVHRGVELGSFKKALTEHLAHEGTFGINDIETLFPNAKNVQQTPEWIDRRQEWVSALINGVKHTPFSRIRSMSADITHDEARAKGYVKGTLKKEEFFGLASRITTPATIYKKQKLDRDDIIDITEFDVVIWLKGEMRGKLEEEVARAILLGDGRAVDDEDKVKDPASLSDGAGIRSIAHDHDFYAHQVEVTLDDPATEVQDWMEAVLRARKSYKGLGNPTFYTSEDRLTDALLSRDGMGRRHFKTVEDVAAELRVSKIIPVDLIEADETLIGIMVNISDYTVGADRGGQIATFEDFDIDYNQNKYLIETRMSGALTKHKSAVVFRTPVEVPAP